MELFSLQDQVAIVTGAGSGIGQSVAVGFAKAGADVLCFDLPTSTGLDETAKQIQANGRKALAFRGSVTEIKDLSESLLLAKDNLGAVTIALNAAGIANACPAQDMEEEQWDQLMNINLRGLFLSCQAEARHMIAHGLSGTIINIASMSGSIVNRGLTQCHYNTSKAGVLHLSKSLAMEWCNKGIRVNAISPGYTATPMNTRPEMVHQTRLFEEQTPMERMASVNEMVGPAIFLASQASSFCTGIDLLVDGGFTCW